MRTRSTGKGAVNVLNMIHLDLSRLEPKKTRFRHVVSTYLFDPGFKSVVIYRVQQQLTRSFPRLCLLISSFNLRLTGAQFCVGVEIASGLIVRHPSGIVLGGGVIIGENCILAQGVTIGQKEIGATASGEYPILGSGIELGAHSTLIGGIRIGHNVTVGAMTLVNKDVREDSTVVGIPFRYAE